MGFLVLALTNLRRHRIRALIGVAGIGFGVAAMLTILSVVNGAIGMFERILSSDSHYLVFERNVSDLFFSSVPEADVAAVARLPQVKAAHPLLFGVVSSPGYPVITCFGVQADDPRLARAAWLSGTRADFGMQPGVVVLGARAADFLHAGLGARVEIGASSLVVSGIIRTENGFEDGGVFMPLAQAQDFFHKQGVCSVVAISLKDKAQGVAFKEALEHQSPKLIALENKEFNQSYHSFKILTMTAWAVGLCSFLLGGLGVANTMVLSVFSRIREIAVLQVCGFSERQIGLLILVEATLVALAGLALGLGLGALALSALPHIPQFQGYVHAEVSASLIAGIVVTALVTAVAGAIYPARFAAGIQPAEALRYE